MYNFLTVQSVRRLTATSKLLAASIQNLLIHQRNIKSNLSQHQIFCQTTVN